MIKIQTRKMFKAITITTLALSLAVTPNLIQVGTAEAATRPGHNGKIVYSSYTTGDNQIYTIDSDGSNKIRLTNNASGDGSPKWSPDGNLISFRSWRDGDREIYVMNADGSNQRRITNSAGPELGVVWSPDSSKLAYHATRSGNSDIYIYNLDTSTEIRLTTDAAADIAADWSPDGTKIAYRSEYSGNRDVTVIDVEELTTTRITTAIGSDYLPYWSPDGSKILFQSLRHGSGVEMYIIDADGSNETRLTNTPGFDEIIDDPWSPSGQYFAVVKYNSSWTASTVEVIAVTGEVHKVIDLNSIGLSYPERVTWSPDGENLLITAYADSNMDAPFLLQYSLGTEGIQYMADDEASGYGHWLSISNTNPVTTHDSISVPYQTPTLADVLANDTDEEALSGDNLSIVVQPSNGTASTVDGKVRYVPNNGFQGADSLTYEICDSFMLDQKCGTGVLNITVQAPTAPALTVSKVNGENFSSETNSHATASLRPTFSGTATPGSEIKVEIHSDPIVLTTTADGSGNWSVTPTFDLPTGEHMVYISATLNGLTTELDSFGLTVGALANTGESLRWIVLGGLSLVGGSAGLFGLRRKEMMRVRG